MFTIEVTAKTFDDAHRLTEFMKPKAPKVLSEVLGVTGDGRFAFQFRGETTEDMDTIWLAIRGQDVADAQVERLITPYGHSGRNV